MTHPMTVPTTSAIFSKVVLYTCRQQTANVIIDSYFIHINRSAVIISQFYTWTMRSPVAVTWVGMSSLLLMLLLSLSHLFDPSSHFLHFLPHILSLSHFLFHGVNLAQLQSLKRIFRNHLAITFTIPTQFNPSSLKHFLKQDILPCIKVNWIGCQCHRLLPVLLLPLQPQGLHLVLKDHHNFLLRPSGKKQILLSLGDGVKRKLVLRNTHLMLILPLMTTCIEATKAIASYFLMATLTPLAMFPIDITNSVLGGKATCNFSMSHHHILLTFIQVSVMMTKGN